MFQIVLTKNRHKIKVLYDYKRENDANNRFKKLKSQVVFFPKTKIYKGKELQDVGYEVLLLKKKVEGDKNRIVKNEIGKFVEEVSDNPEWSIIASAPYPMEENFNVTGANRKLTGKEILDNLVLTNKQKNNPKQLLLLKNKLIIESLSIYVVTCKNTEQAIKLYNRIRTHCYDNKITNILFFGTIVKKDYTVWYKRLHSRLGIGYNRLYRASSR
jgi:hypothetical protein